MSKQTQISTVIERLDPRLGMVLAERYRLLHKIAAGGFGAVYIANDLVANRDVAVKLLHPALAADPNMSRRDFAAKSKRSHR